MDLEKVRNFCLKKKGTAEDFPFDEDTLVFKVKGKMFCLTSFSNPFTINLKCDPELAAELREKYDGVIPGYHMNKKYWNTVSLNSDIPDAKIYEWINHSYDLVVNGLPKNIQKELRN